MDKKLQDYVWQYCLPKEFKEEVKKEYYDCKHCNADACAIELEIVFGRHNLTSDAEGEEEVLTVSRKDMQFYYQYYKTKSKAESNAEQKAYYKGRTKVLLDLFGSKCLPDAHEENFATKEPTLKRGDIVRVTNARHSLYEGLIGTVDTVVKGKCHEILVNHRGSLISFHASELEPYTEPTLTDDCQSQCKSQDRDRLHIAAQILAGFYANETYAREFYMDKLVKLSLEVADALIAECGKGGDQ